MAKKSAELSGTERAFVQMCMEEHAALVRSAEQNRGRRMNVLLREKGIPEGVDVHFSGEALEYEAPDIPAAESENKSIAEA